MTAPPLAPPTVPPPPVAPAARRVPGPVAVLLALGAIGVLAACWGWFAGSALGAVGPSLAWVGGALALVAFVAALLLAALGGWVRRARPAAVPELRRAWRTALSAGGAAVVGLLGLEVVLGPPPPSLEPAPDPLGGILREDPELGWSGRPDASAVMVIGGVRLPVRLDEHGFRDRANVSPDGAGAGEAPCVVVVGDSTAWGYGVQLEESWAFRLRGLLPGARVWNRSCNGWALDQVVLAYPRHVRPLQPNVVVLGIMLHPGGRERSRPLAFGLRKPWFTLDAAGVPLAHGVPLAQGTAAENEQWAEGIEAAMVRSLPDAWDRLVHEFLRRHVGLVDRTLGLLEWTEWRTEGFPPPHPVTLALVRRLRELAAADGARLIVALSPGEGVFLAKEPVRMFAPVAAAIRSCGVDVVDFTPLGLPEGRALDPRDGHYTPEGHRRLAEALAPAVRAHL